jgi:uncharacterized protein YutE (UPF0331/DUF86 family)
MLNYLLLDYVVVSREKMGVKGWMKLCKMAEMFCLGRLLSICEHQLCSMVSEDSFRILMEFALDVEMDILALWCADFQIKLMVTREDLCEELSKEGEESVEAKAKK